MTKRFMVAGVFLAGCAVGGVSSQLVVPKASAQQGSVTRWEYFCPAMSYDSVATPANKAGSEGWEMVNYDPGSGIGCFKRPKM